MKDDSLSDVQVKAQRQQADTDRSKMFEDSAKQSVHGVEVWNAAIEAAAKAAMNAPIFPKGYGSSERDGRIIVMMDVVMTEIRKLKK